MGDNEKAARFIMAGALAVLSAYWSVAALGGSAIAAIIAPLVALYAGWLIPRKSDLTRGGRHD